MSKKVVEDVSRVLLGVGLSLSHTTSELGDRPIKAISSIIRQNKHLPSVKPIITAINVNLNDMRKTENINATVSNIFYTAKSSLSSLSPLIATLSSSGVSPTDIHKSINQLIHQMSGKVSPSIINALLSMQPFIPTTPPPSSTFQSTSTHSPPPPQQQSPSSSSSSSSSSPISSDELKSAIILAATAISSHLPPNVQSSIQRLTSSLPTAIPSNSQQAASATAIVLQALAVAATEMAQSIQGNSLSSNNTAAYPTNYPAGENVVIKPSHAADSLKSPPIFQSSSQFSPDIPIITNSTSPISPIVDKVEPAHPSALLTKPHITSSPELIQSPQTGASVSSNGTINPPFSSTTHTPIEEISPSSSDPLISPQVRFAPRERRIPSSPIGRILGFGGIAARMVTGSIYDKTRKLIYGNNNNNNTEDISKTISEPIIISSTQNHATTKPVNVTGETITDPNSYQTNAPSTTKNPIEAIPFTNKSSSSTSSSQSYRTEAFSSPSSSSPPSVFSHLMSESSTERLAEGLCRMRGAALKVGQMLSIQDDSLLPPQLRTVLDRVRDGADVMPRRQLERTLVSELGNDWMKHLTSFDWNPIAAASIGQVHKAVLTSGETIVMKVQYPGVADSINSDVNNVKMLVKFFNVLPPGAYLNETMNQAKEELALECDYIHEKKSQDQYKSLLASPVTPIELQHQWYVPSTYSHLTTKRVLTSEYVDGIPINQLAVGGRYPLSQQLRNDIARSLLHLCLTELFVYRYMQTDPNWSNFLYEPTSKIISLIDFGACRTYPKLFVDEYIRMVYACAHRDREGVIAASLKMGFLTGDESKEMLNAHVEAAFVVGEPFLTEDIYDFSTTTMASRVAHNAGIMLRLRLTPPPKDSYTLHRKLSGCFLTARKLGAKIHCRDLFINIYKNYKFGM